MQFYRAQREVEACIRSSVAIFLLVAIMLAPLSLLAQAEGPSAIAGDTDRPAKTLRDISFRVEVVPVEGGAEIVTILMRRPEDPAKPGPVEDLPLVSVLRDTLGDDIPENDRLRYVWMLTYTKPSFRQKVAGFMPFFYTRTRNKGDIGDDPPPPIIDLGSTDKAIWSNVFWMVFKKIVMSEIGVGVRAGTLQYKQNALDYKRTAVAAALTVLSLYQETSGEKVLSEGELTDIQARLFLSDKMFGWHVRSEYLNRVYDKETTLARDYRGHNWELLRQYAEAEGLYFDPIEMPDGSSRHAIVWASAADIKANQGRKFNRRFLNIKNPWDDDKLLNWKGYAEVRWYDAEDREVESDTPGARPRTLIPLALYGLDHPKVPVILVDFRDNGNPKFREISKRVLNDLTGNVLSLSQFSGLPFFVGRFIYDFATGRRGLDINQTSRLRAYAQLKLLISLDASIDGSLDPDLRNDVAGRVESATLNPLQNDAEVELRLAQGQYKNLIAWAQQPDGLPKRLQNDRREEMTRIKHARHDRALFALGHLLSLGLYTHRETPTSEMIAKMDLRRQLDYHERFLREVAFESAEPRIDTDVDRLKRSLTFVAQHGEAAEEKTVRALAKIFSIANESDLKELTLASLYRVNNSSAKKELLAVYNNDKLSDRWRNMCANYLKLALQEKQRISKTDAHAISAIGTN